MNYLGLILGLALVAGQVLGARINVNDGPLERTKIRGYDEKFHDFLDGFRTILQSGNDTLGIPPMDPFNHEHISFDIAHEKINGAAEFTNIGVVGLSGYEIDQAKIALLSRKITLRLTWPQIYSEGSYKFNVALPNGIAAFGDGSYTVTVNYFSFECVLKLSVFNGLKVKEIATKIELGGLKLDVTGLLGDEEASQLISAAVSDMAPELVNDYQPELTKIINEMLTELINKRLEGKTLGDIMEIFG